MLAAPPIVFPDDLFRVCSALDPTKLLAFDLSGVSAGEVRTLEVPDLSGEILLADTTQDFETTGTISGINVTSGVDPGHTHSAYLTAETDPVFVSSPAFGIGSGDITNWDSAYGWGDHALAGYLTSEVDTFAAVVARGSGANATVSVGVGNALTLAAGSITDTSGAISFGDENLTTTGMIGVKISPSYPLDINGNVRLNGYTVIDTTGTQTPTDLFPLHVYGLGGTLSVSGVTTYRIARFRSSVGGVFEYMGDVNNNGYISNGVNIGDLRFVTRNNYVSLNTFILTGDSARSVYFPLDNQPVYWGAGHDAYILYTGSAWDFRPVLSTSSIRFNYGLLDTDFIVYGVAGGMLTLDAGTLGATFGGGVVVTGDISGGSLKIDTTTLVANLSGYENKVGIGTNTPNNTFQVEKLLNFDDANFNLLFGTEAGGSTPGSYNFFGGYKAGFGNSIVGGGNNGTVSVYLGCVSGYGSVTGNRGYANVGVGAYSLFKNSTGYGLLGIGYGALYENTIGYDDAAIGYLSMRYAVDAAGCNGFGTLTLFRHQSGYYMNAFGDAALQYSKTGNRVNAFGAYADYFVPGVITTATAVAGAGLEIGLYFYFTSYVLDGNETGLSVNKSVTTTAGNQQVDLAGIPVYSGPLTCTARNIYRTKVGASGTSFVYFVTAIADNITTTYSDTMADASLTVRNSDPTDIILLGYHALATASHQIVIGYEDCWFDNLYLGEGIYAASPHDVTIHATGGSGTDNAGADLILAGGQGTGSAAGGSVIIKTAPAGGAGTVANVLVNAFKVDSDGGIFLYLVKSGATQAAAGAAASEIWKTASHASLPDNLLMIGV